MNKFITRTKPLTPQRHKQKRPTGENEAVADENMPMEIMASERSRKVEEPSVMEKLHGAIREDDAQFTFDLLSKNRPFDQAMNKTMTKMEFAPLYSDSSSEFMLLSVDESVVNAFQEGQSVTIRGESTDHAVLCTETSTFPVKIVESATTVLLLHDILQAPDSPTLPNFEVKMIDGKCFATGELCPAADILDIGRLKDMLREQELKWEWKDREEQEKCKGYRLPELLDVVQMSVGEVKTALADLPVVKFPGGKYRYLSHKFRGEMLGLIVEMLDDEENMDVTMEKISATGLRKHLPPNVPDQVIDWFVSTRCQKTADDVFCLPEANLIRDLSVVILHNAQKMQLAEFEKLLSKILPFGIRIDRKVFDGIADISDAPFGKCIAYLAPEDLPDDVRERMLYLIEHRKLWSMEQLRPYFGDLFKSKVAFDKFVVQNCDYTLSESNEMMYCGVRN